jgi:hypothetical protein
MPPELVNIQLTIADFSAYVVFAQHRTVMRLRCVDELYPQIINARMDARDTLPACSAAESLVRQEPFMNSMLAQHALAMLARLFRHGEIAYHGGFVSQETGRVSPLTIDRNMWARIQNRSKRGYPPVADTPQRDT